MESTGKMLNCDDPSFGGAMYGCTHCGSLKFVPFRCHSWDANPGKSKMPCRWKTCLICSHPLHTYAIQQMGANTHRSKGNRGTKRKIH